MASSANDWTFGFCEFCLKNAHEKVRMVQERICESKECFYVCPECGSAKRL